MPCSSEHPSQCFCCFLFSPSTAGLARFLQTAPSPPGSPGALPAPRLAEGDSRGKLCRVAER